MCDAIMGKKRDKEQKALLKKSWETLDASLNASEKEFKELGTKLDILKAASDVKSIQFHTHGILKDLTNDVHCLRLALKAVFWKLKEVERKTKEERKKYADKVKAYK